MKPDLPKNIIKCMQTLENSGVSAYLVGGCVRDMQMGLTPHDYDITTDSAPEKIKQLFEHTIDTGIKHGTVTVLIDHLPIEITQMRIDGDYADHRHPEKVIPARTLNEDLLRRDFTVNALAMDINGNITDITNGISDIKHKIIRAVGNPYKRFSEDALRIMRAYRFCSQLMFTLDDETQAAAEKSAGLLQRISAERICQELYKTLIGKDPSIIAQPINSGALAYIGLKSCQNADKLCLLQNDCATRLSALIILCDSNAECVCTALKCDNKTKHSVYWLTNQLKNHDKLENADKMQLKAMINSANRDFVKKLIDAAEILFDISLENTEKLFNKIKNEPVFIKELNISGNDLINIGIQGEHIGETLGALQQKVWENSKLNENCTLIDVAKKINS